MAHYQFKKMNGNIGLVGNVLLETNPTFQYVVRVIINVHMIHIINSKKMNSNIGLVGNVLLETNPTF
jgi:hypothetical protein